MSLAEPTASDMPGDKHEPRLRDLFLFMAGGHTYGVYSEQVDGTAEAKRPTPLPQAPAAVLGVVYARGRMLTLLDPLALSVGEAFTWPPLVPAIISLHGDEQLGLAAESFAGTITVSSSDIDTSPPASGPETNLVIAGILRHGGKTIAILEPSQLFDTAVQRKDRRRRRF